MQHPTRHLTNLEKDILTDMLQHCELKYRHLKNLIPNLKIVEVLDEYGSLRFERKSSSIEDHYIPIVTAYQRDIDSGEVGPFVEFILFANADEMAELQIYKQDLGRIGISFDPKKLEYF